MTTESMLHPLPTDQCKLRESDFNNRVCPMDEIGWDHEQVLTDYERLLSSGPDWTVHDLDEHGNTNWNGICLYSIDGTNDDMRCTDIPKLTQSTPAAESRPYIVRELLPRFGTGSPLRVAVRRRRYRDASRAALRP